MYVQGREPSQEQTTHWLRWLSQKLSAEFKTEFAIEEMQPSWLATTLQQFIYQIGVGVMLGVTVGLISVPIGALLAALMDSRNFGVSGVLFLGLAWGLTIGLIVAVPAVICFCLMKGLTSEITPIEAISRWSWKKAKTQLSLVLYTAVGIGIGVGKGFGIVSALILGLIAIPITLLFVGLSGSKTKTKTKPNQGIWDSARTAVMIGVGIWLICALCVVLLQLIERQPIDPMIVIMSASLLGFGFGMFWGGFTCIQHFVLRLMLWHSGAIPWNYARFLDYCTKQGFLARNNGRYQFIQGLKRE